MKLGFSRKDITPDFPVPMAGYFVPDRISQGVHDKLYVRALYFEGSEKGPLLILQMDLIGLDKICLEKINQIEKNSLICATHTHSGFGGFFDTSHGINRELLPLLGENNPALVEFVVTKCAEAITEAKQNSEETTIRINHGSIDGFGTNRRRVDIPYDNSVFTMEFCRDDQKKILLYNLSCHPTVLNSENKLLSADFPGAVAGKLEAVPGGYDMVVFINGSAGDVSTRFTRQASSFEECRRYANLAAETIGEMQNGAFLPLEKAELHYHALSLKRAVVPDPDNARDHLQKAKQDLEKLKNQNAGTSAVRKAFSIVEGAHINLIKAESAGSYETSSEKTIETGILKINDVTIVCSPFELFSSLALILKKKKQVECFGYVNCVNGYLADIDAWDNLDYEALSGDFLRGEGERYIEMVSALV